MERLYVRIPAGTILLAFFIGAPARLFALEASSATVTGACQEDTEKFCGGMPSSTAQAGQCLQQHTVDLSTACRQAVTPARPEWQRELEKTEKKWNACREDVDKYCEGIQVGDNRLVACLKAHRKKLTPACRKAQGL